MNKKFVIAITSVAAMILMSGCMKIVIVDDEEQISKSATQSECASIEKKLAEVVAFESKLNSTRAFHLEELGYTIPNSSITRSTNKLKMLKDAKKRKADLEAEQQANGCEVTSVEK